MDDILNVAKIQYHHDAYISNISLLLCYHFKFLRNDDELEFLIHHALLDQDVCIHLRMHIYTQKIKRNININISIKRLNISTISYKSIKLIKIN